MAYSEGSRLPSERASKLGHLAVVESEWVKSLISNFDNNGDKQPVPATAVWQEFTAVKVNPLKFVWVVDGSYASIVSSGNPPKELAFVKTAMLTIDRSRLE